MRHAYYLEDDPDTQVSMTMLLELELPPDFQVNAFSKLVDLKNALLRKAPDVIVSDLNVLDAGATEVIDVLRTAVPPHVPVILSSGDFDAMAKVRDERRFHFFPKGSDFSVLLSALAQCQVIAR